MSFLSFCSYPVVGVVGQLPGSAHLLTSEGSSREELGVPGEMPDPVCGSREGFPEEGPFCCKLKDVAVSQEKGACRNKNPYRVNSKTKAEREKEITEFALTSPFKH